MRLPFMRPRAVPNAAELYRAAVAEARRPDWYRAAGVADTRDGRFAVLATVLALINIRLERGSDAAQALGPRLAEQFIADMDAQMREEGFGDPSLGKQVRVMVGSLASRVERWRRAVQALDRWDEAAAASLYASPPEDAAKEAGVEATRSFWQRLQAAEDHDLIEGRIA